MEEKKAFSIYLKINSTPSVNLSAKNLNFEKTPDTREILFVCALIFY